METVVFNGGDRSRYSDFLLNSKYKDILQSWEWGEIKSKFNWKAERLGFFNNGQLLGTAQVLERKLPFNFSLFYVPRGPVTDWQNYELSREIISALKKKFEEKIKNKKILFLRLEPPAEKNENLTAIFKEIGFSEYFKTIPPPSSLLIELAIPEEEKIKPVDAG